MEITIDGKPYKVLHSFTPDRCIIDYGLPVLADRNPDGTWDLSGAPAHGDEMEVLKTFTSPMDDKTVVNVVKDGD